MELARRHIFKSENVSLEARRWMERIRRFDNRTGYRIREMETGDERWLLYPVTRDDQESAATRDTMPGAASAMPLTGGWLARKSPP